MVKIVITAPKGHMDSLVVKAVQERQDMEIVGALGPKGRPYIGEDVGLVAGLGEKIGALVYDDLEAIIHKCDVVVDFSTVALSMEVLACCVKHGKAFLCGTTGFSQGQEKALLDAGRTIPVMKAANTSVAVHVMKKLSGIAAAALGESCRIEIIDFHSQTKLDAPSGTAKELANEMVKTSEKAPQEIAFHSVRAGDTPSSHKVLFGCMGEMLEISHHAYSWECCARGACHAILFLSKQPAGEYSMEDVVAL